MFSKSDLTVSVKEMKAFGITLVSVLSLLGGGIIMTNSADETLETALMECEDHKDEYKKYFNEVYPSLAQRYVDVHIWEEFMETTNKHMSAIDKAPGISNFVVRTGLLNTEYENRYFSKNVSIQKEMENYMNSLNSMVCKSKVRNTETRRVYEVNHRDYKPLLRDLRAFVRGI